MCLTWSILNYYIYPYKVFSAALCPALPLVPSRTKTVSPRNRAPPVPRPRMPQRAQPAPYCRYPVYTWSRLPHPQHMARASAQWPQTPSLRPWPDPERVQIVYGGQDVRPFTSFARHAAHSAVHCRGARAPHTACHAAHAKASGRTSRERPLNSEPFSSWMALAASRVLAISTVP